MSQWTKETEINDSTKKLGCREKATCSWTHEPVELRTHPVLGRKPVEVSGVLNYMEQPSVHYHREPTCL